MHPEPTQSEANGFLGLGIAPTFLEILARLRFTTPTPIQAKAIPVAIQGKDIVGIAQTGTGKTLAFGIPMLQRLAQIKGQGLVLLPTRELAIQVDEVLRKIGGGINLRTAVLIGGAPMGPQKTAINKKPHVIVATPGRLIDHLEQRTVRLDGIRIVVFDEADRMLDMGFMPQIKKILQHLTADRQTMLFSATMPPEIMKMASSHMKLPLRVEVAPAGTTSERVTQELFIIGKEQKISLLAKLLETHVGPTLVFTRTKHGAKKIARQIRGVGVNAAEIHSNRSLGQRREALEGFKSGKYRVLVATDIASRGIDVVGIELVVNFDLPTTSDDYVHRIGRTARAGASGHAISFATPDQKKEIRAIERMTRTEIKVSKAPSELPQIKFTETPSPSHQHHRQGGMQRGGPPRRSGPGRFQHRSSSGPQRGGRQWGR
ncbi:MAG: DEAD/DEAH box helicase [bacterium]|nr:DEAD/DEAH box helicase [bacterium]